MSPPVSLVKKSDHLVLPPKAEERHSTVDGLALVMARNNFYVFHYHKILYIVLAQLAGIIILVMILFRLFEFTDSRDYFFPVQQDSTLIIERPLYESVYSDDEMRRWVEEATTTTLTFGYYDYQMRWQDSRGYFTPQGWASYNRAMENVLNYIGVGIENSAKKVILTRVHPGKGAEIKRQGISNGVYTWDFTISLDVTYFGTSEQSRETWNVDLRIVRMPSNISRYGRGIKWLVALKE